MKNSFIKSENGYMTVESSLIMPFMIFLVVFTLIICTVYFQNLLSEIENQKFIVNSAQYWQNANRSFNTGYISYSQISKKGIYSNFNFLDSTKEEKKELLKKIISNKKTPPLFFKNVKVNEKFFNDEININDQFFLKSISITSSVPFKAPFINSQNKCESIITEPVSLIRNIDYISDQIIKIK